MYSDLKTVRSEYRYPYPISIIQTKMAKIYTLFLTKTAKKTTPFGVTHTNMAFIHIGEYPP